METCGTCGEAVYDIYHCDDCGNKVCWDCFEDGLCCELAEEDSLLFAA